MATDEGNAYVKWPDNLQGPPALSSELIGTGLAQWFGLETFPYCVFDAIPVDAFPDSHDETPTPVFATQEVHGEPWNGDDGLLTKVENLDDISWLVVFDTFACNYDRHRPCVIAGQPSAHLNERNVFLSENAAEGRFRFRVYDHTLCEFALMDASDGDQWRGKIKDPTVYGLFPQFRPYLAREQVAAAAAKLATLDAGTIDAIVDAVPTQWIQQTDTPIHWKEFIEKRAAYVADTIESKLFPQFEIPYED